MDPHGLILKLASPDRPGIVARIASYVAGHNGNLLEFSQFTDREANRFFARLEIDTRGLDVQVDDFIAGFGTLGRALGRKARRGLQRSRKPWRSAPQPPKSGRWPSTSSNSVWPRTRVRAWPIAPTAMLSIAH